jgi:hypothetical protein
MALSFERLARFMKACCGQGRSQEESEDLILEGFPRLHVCCRNSEVRNEEAFLARTVPNLAMNEY